MAMRAQLLRRAAGSSSDVSGRHTESPGARFLTVDASPPHVAARHLQGQGPRPTGPPVLQVQRADQAVRR